jgi:glycerol-3-phosphate acyltransferase PlsY
MNIYLLILVAFLLGSIPVGVLLAKLFALPDPRKIGSGNIGATNMLRTGRKDIAAATLLLDALKGAVAILLIPQALYNLSLLVLLSAIIGHCYSPWLKFKGGKGVATYLGGMLAFAPIIGGALCAIWLIIFVLSRISSLSALTALAFAPVLIFWQSNAQNAWLALLISILIFYKHRANIGRIWRGEETKFGKSTSNK